MRWVLFSDVHGNLEALQAVLERLEALEYDAAVCLGDTVGYGANPNECLALVRKHCDLVLLGNHDAAAIGLLATEDFNDYARAAIEWTAEVLAPEHKAFLAGCKPRGVLEHLLLAHSSLEEDWRYVLDEYDAAVNFQLMGPNLRLCVGHSHVAEYYRQPQGGGFPEGRALVDGQSLKLAPDFKYLVNVGSVGQPRDGDWRAAFVVWEKTADEERLTCHRCEYALESAQAKIRAAHLPEILAYRLEVGQ